MLSSPHAAVGATLGALIPNPWLVIPIAIASHFILDTVPHWQETLAPYTPTTKTYVRLPIDIALAVGITWLVAQWHPQSVSTVWIGAVSANIPDLDSLLVVIPHALEHSLVKPYWDWHCRIQNETSQWLGVWIQVAVIAGALAISFVTK